MISVTIGLPVYNEEKNIGRLLNYIHKSKFDFDLKEILIVCSGCTDKSVEIIKKWMEKEQKIKLFTEKRREGKSSAMSTILKYAKGDYILFIDADTLPLGNALNILTKPLNDSNVAAVTGRPIPTQSSDSIIGYFQNLIWDFHHDISFSFRKITGYIFVIKKGSINKIPHKIINDDAYVAVSIPKNHGVVYQPNTKTLLFDNLNLKSYIEKRRRIAQGFIQLSKAGLRTAVPLRLILKLVIKRMAKEPRKLFHIILAVLIEIYCNVLAYYDITTGRIEYIWERNEQNWENGRAGI